MTLKSGKKKGRSKSSKKISNTALKKNRTLKNYSINHKLDQILTMQKKLLNEENAIVSEESKIEELEKENEVGEELENKKLGTLESEFLKTRQTEDDELLKLQQLEEDIKKEVKEHPLRKITAKDIIKGFVGAFVGLAVHYTFTYGVELSTDLDFTRATFLYFLAFFVGLIFIYATGFRKINDPKVLMFMPIRLLILYIASIITSIFVLFIFYPGFGHNFAESYKMVAGVLLAAIVGACTADLIGKD
jgi:uncharacterized membrane protein